MRNIEIQEALKKASLKQWELADLMGICETTLCKKLRYELSDNEKKAIIDLIEKNAKGVN